MITTLSEIKKHVGMNFIDIETKLKTNESYHQNNKSCYHISV